MEGGESKGMWTFKLVVPIVLLGYLMGILLALSWYWWHPYLRSQDMGKKWLSVVGIVLLVIGLFYNRVVRWERRRRRICFNNRNVPARRCFFALSIPSLFGGRGRAFLISFAFVIVTIGPVANILANLRILLRTLACAQELLRQALGQMLEVILEPVHAVRLAVNLMMQEVRKVLNAVMVVLMRIQEHLIVIIDTLKNCATWLKSVVDLCNAEMGTPWERCKNTANAAMVRCQEKLGLFKAFCHATKLFLALCYPAKIIDVFCSGFSDFSWTVLDQILTRYHAFVRQIEQMFDANITFDHEFSFETNSSKSLADVGEEVVQDINQRLSPLAFLIDLVDILCWLMVFSVFIKSFVFYVRFMHSRGFQNFFITELLEQVDQRYRRHGSEPLLPLHRLERMTYMKLTSLRLTQLEIFTLIKNATFMILPCLQLFCVCFVDYGLFWLLAMMSFYGHQEAGLEVPAYIDLEIKGGGFVGDIMRGIANAFRPLTQKTVLETNPCLPLPVEPKYSVYFQIGGLCLLAWLIVLAEPYVLRLRHPIMAYFHPERAHERAVFLHRTIFLKRETIFKFARRRARNKFTYQGHVKHYRWVIRLRKLLAWCCRCCNCLRGRGCIICSRSFASLPLGSRYPCKTPDCKGVYCKECYEETEGVCCLCKRPLDYGDFSDCSEVDLIILETLRTWKMSRLTGNSSSERIAVIPLRKERCHSYWRT
ncbi:DC-STAMP domain-containing protein 2 isoform X1 [Drosophila ananassae]|uniref:DC-STAMP domain-containing protein 2 isoform X1 n=1 Tax=Drosophila ananassae TaxID=7217 RepID=UPI0013A5F286|nr:DC-STAMP domain-containing protein 2 isoform X1 [Drosophila ananassae]